MKFVIFLFSCLAIIACGSHNSSSDKNAQSTDTTKKEMAVTAPVKQVGQDSVVNNQNKTTNVTPETNKQQEVKPKPSSWVVGNWKWLKTKCCSRKPVITTPDGQHSMSITIKEDGAYEKKENRTLTKGKYSMGTFSAEDNRPTLKFDDNQPALLQGGNDSLILNYGYMDKQTEWYVRAK